MTKPVGSARSCELCLVWSVLRWSRICSSCKAWKAAYRERGVCPRCRHEAHLNPDGLCRPCLAAIRAEEDAEWALLLPEAGPRALQLHVGIYNDPGTRSRPLVRQRGGGRQVNEAWRSKLRRQQAVAKQVVLEPQVSGQLPLFTAPRRLSGATVSALAGRPVEEWERVRPVLKAIAARHRLSYGWEMKVGEMARLALAVRTAEGAERLPEPLLRDLPNSADAVRLILLEAGLLEPAPQPMRFSRADQPGRAPYLSAPLPPPAPRSCVDCQAWVPARSHRSRRCTSCRHWRQKHARGRCGRCGRDHLPLRNGRCRSCYPYQRWDAAWPSTSGATQLTIDLPAAVGGWTSTFPVEDPTPRTSGGPPPTQIVGRGQTALFTLRRSWEPVLERLRGIDPSEMPMTRTARALVDELDQMIKDQRSPAYRKNIRTLATLVYWLGADQALHERDVYDLAALDANMAAKPVCQFLAARGLLVEDPALHRDAAQVRVETVMVELPQPLADEVRAWVKVLRAQGRREDEPRSWSGIRRYLACLQPTLTSWTNTGVTSLREITPDHIEQALSPLTGHNRRQLSSVLRSCFRALKRERIIFLNPARNLPVGDWKSLPTSIPSDRLAGLLDEAGSPFGRLVVALVAIHALPAHEILALRTVDLDLAHGTLEVRRGLLRHTLYLEELTHRLASQWLAYRHRRWPASANPHLLVSQKTAPDPDHPPVAIGTLRLMLPRGLTLSGLRQDRILNEARETADPLRLVRLFGIAEQTAMRYVGAAHPERTAKLPR
ncbi:site-specific integrase [Streptomyces rimosus]|uniref:site-specific integrase n=1 Tax=Streptomyces rimosus TaxID=1927 RepID=UPI0004C4BD45|nr:site-specific integrase [Streptomyces rimosus]